MASFSKIFPGSLDAVSCREAFHPYGSCWHGALSNFSLPLPSCAKFFVPIFCFQLVRRILSGNYNRHTLPELFDVFLRTTLCGYLGSACGQTCCCIMYHLFGKFYLHTTVAIPVSIGNLVSFVMPAEINSMFGDYLCMMIVESYYRCDETLPLQLVKRSAAFRTLLFMAMSAIILNTNRILKTDVMWFIQAAKKPRGAAKAGNATPAEPSELFDRWLPVGEHVCAHAGSCDAYVLQGVKNNVKLAVIIELVRFVIENMMRLRRSPWLMLGVFGQIKLRVISFFVGYTTFYRMINCALNRYQHRNTQIGNTVAAIAAGSVFCLYPDLTILSHATVSAVKLLWMRYLRGISLCPRLYDGTDKSPGQDRLRAALGRLPMSRIMYVLAIGYVFHLRLFYPWMCSDLLFKTTFYTSGFVSDRVTVDMAKHLMGAAG